MMDTVQDPTEQSRWRPVFRLLSGMDDEIARIYAENGIPDLKTNWVLEIIRLHVRGPMTIAELARSVERTHSAMSQKVALTPKAERVAAKLAAEWRATEASVAEIEAEIPYPLTRAAGDIAAALTRKSFHDRIAEKLAQDPAWADG